MRGTLRTQKNDRRGLNLHSVGTCKGIMTCGMIIMSKKDALRTQKNVRRASAVIGRPYAAKGGIYCGSYQNHSGGCGLLPRMRPPDLPHRDRYPYAASHWIRSKRPGRKEVPCDGGGPGSLPYGRNRACCGFSSSQVKEMAYQIEPG